jgi:hypothetical protein
VTNTGTAPTDGATPVTLTDVVDPDMSMVSISGTGWTCDTSNDPTEVCTETGGAGGGPAVLRPGQSYPPVTLTVSLPQTAGYGTQDSTAGLHVTNAVTVSGGASPAPSTAIAPETPVAGLPDLTADNAVASAFRQGDAADEYQITVLNQGGGPTSGSSSSPVTATITALPAGVSLQSLYGSGWTCHLDAITSPQAEPADTCYRSDVLAGENGEEPPITAVVSVAGTAPATGNETVAVSGGGDAAAPASVSAATTIAQAADLTATSTHAGSFAQGDSSDSYTLTVANAKGPNSTAGGPALGQVAVTDALPWGLTATGLSGSGWTCDVGSVTCYRADPLAAGSSYPPITATVSVAANVPASVTNSVTVSGGGMTAASAGGGQTGTDPTTISQSGPAGTPPAPPSPPSLSVASSHAGPFGQGDAADSYTLTVSNASGAGSASGLVTVTDAVPAGLTPVELTGPGWTCSLAPVTLPGTPNLFEPDPTCSRIGTLAAGAAYPPITLTVATAGNAPPSLINTVTVTGGGDPGPASGTDPTTVTQLPALTVTSLDTAHGVPYAPLRPGDGARAGDDYDITVANDGYAATSGAVTLTAALPAGLTALAMSGSGWSCQVATAACTRSAPLAAGQQSEITLAVAVARDAPASVALVLQASGGGQLPAAALDTGNLASPVTNGGAKIEQTAITPAG